MVFGTRRSPQWIDTITASAARFAFAMSSFIACTSSSYGMVMIRGGVPGWNSSAA